ncbi:DMT family transporter [Bacillus pseudomycoides]|uniref:DMT family transporter n=1 Tax=Bacillus pseudomycoides TaxID=64104 RepID=UPI000BEC5379|nr:DMT family transporter [Bacillus pseudomycoides]PEE39792.1 EamA family transporter [Bacillus pseudomycoides]PEI95694.1 EamA family transporter [Bacillus pseudomycoides]PGA90596.1 EamA family transporter [Bacillus pseudomycoides]PHF35151.1 EamA family transporter [Bacillus pseudomycoides]
MQSKKCDFRILFAYGLTITLWGTAFPGIRFGLEAYSPEHLTLLRLLIASFMLLILAYINKMKLPELKDIPMIFILGGLGFTVYHIALNYGEKSVSVGPASLIVSVTPIFTAILALIFLGEKLKLNGWIGGVISLIGITFLSLGDGDLLHLNRGVLLILLAAFSESLFFVFQKSYLKKYGFLTFTTYTIWAGTLWMLIFLPGIDEEIIKAPIEVTLSAIYLGLCPTVLPYIALAYITSHIGASEATSSLYLTPVMACFVAWIWLGEVPTFTSIVGGSVTIIGVLIAHITSEKINYKQNKKML